MMELGSRHDDIPNAAESGIGNLEGEDLARDVGYKRIGRGEVYPRRGECEELGDGVIGSEGGVDGSEGRNDRRQWFEASGLSAGLQLGQMG
jgi:hypothetical protein